MGTLTANGISTTKRNGQFAYEVYYLPQSRIDACQGRPRKERVQWDYRDSKGNLFSGIAKTIEGAKAAARQQSGEPIAQ